MDAGQLVRQLAALEDSEIRARRAAELLAALPPRRAVFLLGELLTLAEQRKDPTSSALEGALRGVHVFLGDDVRATLRAAAAELDLPEVGALLTASPASRSFDLDREQWVDREMRAQTLGMRKQLARTSDRDLLMRLASDQDPSVLRHLLANPHFTEREVLVAASRRPARAAVLEEIFRSDRWARNRRVRRALALNPYSPPSLAVAALALLTAPDLREVLADRGLAAEVREQARRMLELRTGKAAPHLAPPPPPPPAPVVAEEPPLDPEEEARLVAEAEALLAAAPGPPRS